MLNISNQLNRISLINYFFYLIVRNLIGLLIVLLNIIIIRPLISAIPRICLLHLIYVFIELSLVFKISLLIKLINP